LSKAERQKQQPEDGADLIKAIQHPLRRKILRVMFGIEKEISPRELYDRWNSSLSGISYHVRVLRETGAIKLVRTRPVRGSMQHFYVLSSNLREALWVPAVLGLAEGDMDDVAESRDGGQGKPV
jgi:DNA-binding transcriptional ArsR family regulator